MKWFRRLSGLICLVMVTVSLVPAFAVSYPYEKQSGDSVKLRKTASTSAVVLATIQPGDTVTILGVSGKFYKVTYGKYTGYAMKEYIDSTANVEASIPVASQDAPLSVDSYPYDTTTITAVKLRKSATEDAAVALTIPQGEIITVYEVTPNAFAKVKYNGRSGYVMTAYINLAAIPTPTPIPEPTVNPETTKYTELKVGSKGDMVQSLQEALTELGYYAGTVDAKYGAQTKTAVTAFEKRNALTEDGVADGELQLLLYEGKPKNSKGTRKTVKTLPPVSGVTIKSGSTGEPVKTLQTRLANLGYYSGEISGTCDKATVNAIKAFQKKHSITVDGIADASVQDILYGAIAMAASDIVTPTPAPTIAPPSDTVRSGDSSTDAKRVQQRLKELGYYTGKLDGIFGRSSVSALKAFQEKSGLRADGVCGSATITALFGTTAIYDKATSTPAPEPTAAPITEDNVVVITSGTRGNAVLRLQTRLAELGYYSSRLDGVYLDDDITAVRAFQKANGLKVDGKAGYETQKALYSDNATRGDVGGLTSTATLRYGDTGSNVSALQNRLIELGYLTGSADGRFGVATKTALVAFQKGNGLATDGVAGASTQTALYSDSAVKMTVATSTTLKQGTVSSAVRTMQMRLISLGYLSGSADGNYGAQTMLAVMTFQKRNSLTADGVAGEKTLAALNSSSAKAASGASDTKVDASAPEVSSTPSAANVRYANWYSEVKARCRLYPNATVYDFTTGISWRVNMFSLGAHADAEPLTAEDTANMNRAFGKTTWTPKAVWVIFSDGRIYMASTHNTPHDTSHIRNNDFNGHLCIHFPRTEAQVAAIGSYATSHQKAIDLGWEATLRMASK